jgi:predicted component of type VI protein secretion system
MDASDQELTQLEQDIAEVIFFHEPALQLVEVQYVTEGTYSIKCQERGQPPPETKHVSRDDQS